MIAGVAYQRPSRSKGFAKEERQVRCAIVTFAACAALHPFSQLWYEGERLHEVAFDIGAHLVEIRMGPVDDRQGLLVIGGERDDHPLGPWIEFPIRDRDTAP